MALTPIALLLAFVLGIASYHTARIFIEQRRVAAGALPTMGSEFIEEDTDTENKHTLRYISSGLVMALGMVLTNNLVSPLGWTDLYALLLNGAIMLFLSVILALAWIDGDTQILPSKLIYWGGGASLALLIGAAAVSNNWALLIPMAVGGIMYFAVYFAIWWFAPRAFGFGDVRLSFFIGAFLSFVSPSAGFVGFVAAWLLALVAILIGSVFGMVKGNIKIAFGPWMVLGAFVGLFFGSPIVTMLAL